MFRSVLVLRSIPERPGYFRLEEPLVWIHGDECVAVPPGFVTDLASIPRPVQLLPSFALTGRSMPCGVLHDYGYACQRVSRQETDELFRRSLLAVGVNRVAARLFWLGVRAGGWLPWNRYAKAKESRP